jgi:predicted dehydrogenase
MSSAVKRLQTETVPHKPRLGFVGLGWIGRNRLESVVQADVAEISALHDVQECSVAEAQTLSPGAVSFSSFDELLRHDLDGVVIATPNRFHTEQAIAALECGAAVFCQKPLGRNAFETRRIVDAARSANCLLGVDLSYSAIPAMQTVSSLVKSGELGKIFAVDAKFHNGYGPDKPWFYDFSLSGGGCLLDLGSHLLDLALRPLEYPRISRVESSLFSRGELLKKRGQEIEDYVVATIQTADNTVINLSCCWNLNVGRDAEIAIAFYGTEGGAALRNVNGSFFDVVGERFNRTQTETLSATADANWKWGGLVTVDWINRLASGERFDPEAQQFVTVAEVIDEIYSA